MTAPMKPAVAPWWAYACLAAAMAVVGSYVALSKLLVAVFPIFLLAWLRFGIAAVAMARWVRRDPGEPRLSPREPAPAVPRVLLRQLPVLDLHAVRHRAHPALAAGVILASLPAVVALLSWLLLGERVGARVAAGIACAMGGIVLVAFAGEGRAARLAIGG